MAKPRKPKSYCAIIYIACPLTSQAYISCSLTRLSHTYLSFFSTAKIHKQRVLTTPHGSWNSSYEPQFPFTIYHKQVLKHTLNHQVSVFYGYHHQFIVVFLTWFFLFRRDLVKANQANMNLYNTQMDSGLVFNEPVPETLMSFYQSSLGCDPISAAKASNKDDSSLTYNVPAVAAPRKRARDSINDDNFDAFHASQKTKVSPLSSFIDHDILFQIQQQQSEIDRFIDDHVSCCFS